MNMPSVLKCVCVVLARLFSADKCGCFTAGLAMVLGCRDSKHDSLPVLKKVSFSTRYFSSCSGRGSPADAFCWDLRI